MLRTRLQVHLKYLLGCYAKNVTGNPFRRSYAVRIRWWPTLENPWTESALHDSDPSPLSLESTVDYEVSKDDFKWVERLIQKRPIPPPPSAAEMPTPSGWVAPNPELNARFPYFVRRTKNHMLPVYYSEKQRKTAERSHGTRQLTVIKHIDGDMWALADDLRQLLTPKCDGKLFMCQVDETTRRIRIEGLFLEDVAQFLLSCGF